jgi:lysophospholipid acyltransferase (LPLAT)-like uncharacterized protein
MRVFKRLMRSSAMVAVIGWLIAAYMVIIKYTTRWQVEQFENIAPLIESCEGFIAMTWHSRFLMLNSAWKKNYALPHVLISRSRDGAIVAQTTRFLGLRSIRGSSKKRGSDRVKGGAQASLEIVGALDRGGCVVITPDGPRGPRQRVGDGPLRLARMTGAKIVPCIFSVSRRKQFNSWDKFILPLPFGRGKIIWGSPITLSESSDDRVIEAQRLALEADMNTLLAEADLAMGHAPVLPE